MKRKRHSAEQIVRKLREAESLLGEGRTMAEVLQHLAISEQTYYRWRNQYGGIKADEVKRLKELDLENKRLKNAVADLTLDKQILQEALKNL